MACIQASGSALGKVNNSGAVELDHSYKQSISTVDINALSLSPTFPACRPFPGPLKPRQRFQPLGAAAAAAVVDSGSHAWRGGILWWWPVTLMVLALAAHAQPTEWRSYPFGSATNYSGTDQQGREWTARSYDLASTTYTTIKDPTGRERRCSSYVLTSETITRCEP
jgi:hypothetical protein